MCIREPFEKISSLFTKRTKAAECLRSDLLEEIIAIKDPLPFFLEYPYRAYQREDDRYKKIKAGQRLLSVLTKVPLYFVAEELLELDHELGKEILGELEIKPPSDGTLVKMQEKFANNLKETSVLSCFGGLLQLMADQSELDRMVSARNRMHHEPFDEESFLTALNENVPRWIDRCREAMRGCQILRPDCVKFLDGETFVFAEDLRSRDSTFREVKVKIEIDPVKFQVGHIIAYRSLTGSTVTLNKLFKGKIITSQSLDLGVFDRMEKGKREYVFLRSD